MPSRSWLPALFAIAACVAAAASCGSPPLPEHVLGAYRFDDGDVVSVRPSLEGTLRYRRFHSGESGRLYRIDERTYVSGSGFSSREPVALTVEFAPVTDGRVPRLRWMEKGADAVFADRVGRDQWIEFDAGRTRLVGRLALPEGDGPFPGVVLVHGSGDTPGSLWLYDGDFLQAHGFAVLAFDKRGTGRSEGDRTFDFHRLARDVAAGVEFLRARPEVDANRVGVAGYSQGGWVAPLAATLTEVRFVLVAYGMIESPAEEARLEMLQRLDSAGVDGEARAAAESLVVAAVDVVASGLEDGWTEFQALKRRHRDAPWRTHLDDTPVGQLMRYPRWISKLIGKRRLPSGLDWHYDSTALLDTLDVPMSWFLGLQDRSAPNQGTIEKLRRYRQAGRPFELHVYRDAAHGMVTVENRDGRRVATGYTPSFFRDEVSVARRLAGVN